ncbi:transcriptional regulator [Jeongeupia sp. HS-3]|nr:transcriptional regulator [Jeongeupia sp. HS-3]
MLPGTQGYWGHPVQSNSSARTVLILPNSPEHAISIRAKALTFEAPQSRILRERVHLVAPSDATVLITGESGTGKELIARLVHTLSERKAAPFVAVNCGALSENLIESELFGHEKGAFTGAAGERTGWFEAADGGSLFLDEVGDLPLSMQVKLLRVLQEREVVRVGSRQPRRIDVRLIAATNVDLLAAVRAGRFREDLYYRLNVAPLAIAPLRERREDIPALTRHFLALYAGKLRIGVPALTDAAHERLLTHPWPGNIRELENVIHYALLVSSGDLIDADDLHFTSLAPVAAVPAPRPQADGAPTLEAALLALCEQGHPDLWRHIEETVYRVVYAFCEGNTVQTSRLLNLSRNIVRARLTQFDVRSPERATAGD